MIKIEILQEPVAWAAHGGYGKRAFNIRFRERDSYKWEIKKQYNRDPLLGPVKIACSFYMPIPKGTSKAKRLKMHNGEIHHTKRPDLDNLNKFLCDCLKGIVFKDDFQIFHLTSDKIYSEEGKTVVFIFS